MDESSKNRKSSFRWRFFKAIKQSRSSNLSNKTQPSTSSQSSESAVAFVTDHDTQRTQNRHVEACALLTTSIKTCQQDITWNFLEFPGLEGEHASFDEQFLQKVNHILESRKKDIKDENAWFKCRNTIECVFTVLSPFFKNFFSIATSIQSVV